MVGKDDFRLGNSNHLRYDPAWMSGKRTYGDACGVARALDVLGERWALMIVRELLLGPKRFTDLRAGLPNLSADVLSQRLRGLEEAGVVTRRILPPPAPAKVYELTPAGKALEPALLELGRWGGTYTKPAECGMSLDSHILSLRALFRPERAEGFEARIQLDLCGTGFRAEVREGELDVEYGTIEEPDATVHSDAQTLVDVLHERLDVEEALESGRLEIDGDEEAARRFLSLAPLPEPIGA
jgi:DNA-binding HxlR family transcriptional regulator